MFPGPKKTSQLARLESRASLYADVRSFFARTAALEVVTPVLSFAGNSDPAIASFTTTCDVGRGVKNMYLQTSPEFFMKRLLVAGSGSIYQIASVFRQAESGRFHNPEFSLLEWYRVGYDYQQLMDDVILLIQAVSEKPVIVEKISYKQVFARLKINPHVCEAAQLEAVAQQAGISLQSAKPMAKNDWLDVLMSHVIEPSLDKSKLTFVYDYPASQASLAHVRETAEYPVAERFELYWGGVELANGYTELQDYREQRKRFELDNQQRARSAKNTMPLDEAFLGALERGLPFCSGVALGLDRLLMILTEADSIDEVISFPLKAV